MKYIPLDSFEYVNSLLQAVECNNNYVVTLRLEAFTCRHTREERQLACSLAENYTRTHCTPPLGYSPAITVACDDVHRADSAAVTRRSTSAQSASPSLAMTGPSTFVLPPPLILGADTEQSNYYSTRAGNYCNYKHDSTTTNSSNMEAIHGSAYASPNTATSSTTANAMTCQRCHSNSSVHARGCSEVCQQPHSGGCAGIARSCSHSRGCAAHNKYDGNPHNDSTRAGSNSCRCKSDVVHAPNSGVATAEDVDERLIYLVAALNAIYGDDGYDFAVLTAKDFVMREELAVRAEVDLVLQSLHEKCAPAVKALWPAVEEQVQCACNGCEYYEFCSPSCDPRYGTAIFSHHYLIYNKRRKVLVSLQMYAEDVPNSPCAFESDTSPTYQSARY